MEINILDQHKSKNPQGVWITIPFVASFMDHHQIDSLADFLYHINDKGTEVHGQEIGFKDGQYIGIFYIGENAEYKRLKEKWESGDDDE